MTRDQMSHNGGESMKRRSIAGYMAASAVGLLYTEHARSSEELAADTRTQLRHGESVVIAWNVALRSAIASTKTPPTIAARAISMVHEGAYNAWACYDLDAIHTLPAMMKRPQAEWSDTTKSIAVCYAAHTVLTDLFPTQRAALGSLLAATVQVDIAKRPAWRWAAQIGQLAGSSLLQERHRDGSNQLGDLAPGAYADYSGYAPINTPDLLADATRWQPLRVADAQGNTSVQKCLTPHWGLVRPFALSSGSVLRPTLAHAAPTFEELQELISLSANLTDEQKAIAEYWAGGPGTVTPPGLWTVFAEEISARDRLSLDRDVKLFFALSQALLDASIAAWDAKRAYDSVRPITSIRLAYGAQMIRAWGGPGRGTQLIRGEDWRPYQPATFPTPPFPELVSGHSTFSAAAAEVLKGLRGDRFEIVARVPSASSEIEAGTPSRPITLRWSTLSEAAASAGMSRRYGGIHFIQGDLAGRTLGKEVGSRVLAKCMALFSGRRQEARLLALQMLLG